MDRSIDKKYIGGWIDKKKDEQVKEYIYGGFPKSAKSNKELPPLSLYLNEFKNIGWDSFSYFFLFQDRLGQVHWGKVHNKL